MGKVKTDGVFVYKLTCLFNMSTQDLAKSRLQKVGGGVVAAYSLAALCINSGGNLGIKRGCSLNHRSEVAKHSARGFLGICNLKFKISGFNNARIANLTAALAVENGFVKHYYSLFTLACGYCMFAVRHNVKNFSSTLVFGIAHK